MQFFVDDKKGLIIGKRTLELHPIEPLYIEISFVFVNKSNGRCIGLKILYLDIVLVLVLRWCFEYEKVPAVDIEAKYLLVILLAMIRPKLYLISRSYFCQIVPTVISDN